ncbi:MAG: acetate/propionate family kinase [Candidatus Woesearchaeota archaeon]
MKVFVINSGSSSLKYQLFDMEDDLSSHKVMIKGLIDCIGMDRCEYHYEYNKNKVKDAAEISTHNEAVKTALKSLKKNNICEPLKDIDVIGHRVVHGGDYYKSPALIDGSAISYLKIFSELAPLHNPANLQGIMACKKYLPDTKQVAVFDTSFHQTMPEKAFTYAIPESYTQKDKVRKYGFHGTSHKYLVSEATKLMNNKKNLKIITCHLGNGSSVAASLNGECQDTSMGFTPLDGLPMGTRSGSIDPGALLFLMKKYKISSQEMDKILNKQSGFLGITGMTSDMRDIYNLSRKKNKKAILALEMVEYSLVKIISSYIGILNGVDAIVFSGGMGEKAHYIRKSVCDNLSYAGVKIDGRKNTSSSTVISSPSSKAKVFVIPTNEELQIAREVVEKIKPMIR